MRAMVRFGFVVFIVLSVVSCSKDGADITGIYRLTSLSFSGCDGPLENLSFNFSRTEGVLILEE